MTVRALSSIAVAECFTAVELLRRLEQAGALQITGTDRDHKAAAMVLLMAQRATIFSNARRRTLTLGDIFGFDPEDSWVILLKGTESEQEQLYV